MFWIFRIVHLVRRMVESFGIACSRAVLMSVSADLNPVGNRMSSVALPPGCFIGWESYITVVDPRGAWSDGQVFLCL